MIKVVKRTVLVLFLISFCGSVLVHLFDPDFAGRLVTGKGERDAGQGEALYVRHNCHSCHGERGMYPVLKDYPVIAGQNEDYLYNQIVHIRDGIRTNGGSPYMKEAIPNLTNDEAREIAVYLSRQ